MLQSWAETTGKALEFTTTEGRTFQICGVRGAIGCFERFFHEGSHPTRRNASTDEMAEQLKKAASQFELYRGEKGSGDFFADATSALEAAKQFLSVVA